MITNKVNVEVIAREAYAEYNRIIGERWTTRGFELTPYEEMIPMVKEAWIAAIGKAIELTIQKD